MTESFYDRVKNIVPPGKYRAKIVSVYDGDTVWAILHDLNLKVKIRMTEINTDEMKGGTPETRACATRQRDFVRSLIDGEEVLIRIAELDKYFRHLGTIYVPQQLWNKVDWVEKTIEGGGAIDQVVYEDIRYVNLSTFMLSTGVCGRYTGKGKIPRG